jgi:hypothetical protein
MRPGKGLITSQSDKTALDIRLSQVEHYHAKLETTGQAPEI